MAENDTTQYALGRLEAKLDMLLLYREEQQERAERMESRIAKLEAWRWMLMGAASVLGTGGGFLAGMAFP